ncbi:MAG: hypothetical protein SLRJCFUN_002490 [Candidatus Fervidibacter sp.]
MTLPSCPLSPIAQTILGSLPYCPSAIGKLFSLASVARWSDGDGKDQANIAAFS